MSLLVTHNDCVCVNGLHTDKTNLCGEAARQELVIPDAGLDGLHAFIDSRNECDRAASDQKQAASVAC